MYVITGASGNTGKVLAKELLASARKVRVVGRNADHLKELTDLGAEAAIGNLEDVEFVKRAFTGAEAAYAMIPPNFETIDYRDYQNKVTDIFIEAVKNARMKYVVTLSSVGAHLPEKAGVVQGLYDMEQKWKLVDGVNVLHLRATYFMENTLGQISLVKSSGIMGSPIKGDMKFPMVATKDVGLVAAKKLLTLDFSGKSHQYVLGPRDVGYNEVAGILGKAIGKNDLKYVEFSYDDTKKSMMESWGLSESGADGFIEFMKTANEGKIFEDVVRNKQNTTPTTIEEFSKTFSFVYNM